MKMKKKLYTALTCRTRDKIPNDYERFQVTNHAHLWLHIIEDEIKLSFNHKDIHGYALEIATNKYYQSDSKSRTEFIEIIQRFDSLIPHNKPILWFTHFNPILSESHAEFLESINVNLSSDRRINQRSETKHWLQQALKNSTRPHAIFDPTDHINIKDSDELYTMKDNGLDTHHYPGCTHRGVEHQRNVQIESFKVCSRLFS